MALLPRLQAERQLLAIEAASLPHMTEKARGRVINRYVRRANAERPKTAGEALSTLPIPVIYEPANANGKEVNP